MKKITLLAVIGFSLFCWNNTEAKNTPTAVELTENDGSKAEQISAPEQMTPRGTIYKSYGFIPNVTEWVQVAYNDDVTKIVGIWLWSTLDMEKVQMEITEHTVVSDEGIHGAFGKFNYPGSHVVTEFSSFEDTFTIEYDDGRSQEYTYESFEE